MRKIDILLVEDEKALAFLVKESLEEKGFEVLHAHDGQEALDLFYQHEFYLILLDIAMPKVNGLKVLSIIRSTHPEIPILMLTARVKSEDAVKALTLGANDYIRKPFNFEELLARINRNLKTHRQTNETSNKLTFSSFTLDKTNFTLIHKSGVQKLTYKEVELLAFFIININNVIEKEMFFYQVWGNDELFVSRTLDVFVSRLRKYLKVEPSIEIQNIRGIGYRMVVN
ncbi:response regulator transcription factor [Mongoliitalea lutea]|uniref:DNA-binding response regulator n=1 Tax=Mongoliitalea lutea TaxID=849756 RepID=A0A8J3CWI5_9BACT|nr:response regulator transcription factor [Mongoliitalea lutea]GHB34926.1 DNA-binding response regulator [Mongoliitalea lutea]